VFVILLALALLVSALMLGAWLHERRKRSTADARRQQG
jgi:hypothetical protein